MLTRRQALVFSAIAFAVGCGDKNKDKDDDKKSDDKKGSSSGSSETAPSLDGTAYSMGRKFGSACSFAMLEKSAETATAMKQVNDFGKKLGLTEVAAPTKEEAMVKMRGSEVHDKISDAKQKAAYRLGVTLSDAFLGSMLESDISSQVSDIKTHAQGAGVPESVYKAKHDAVAAGANSDNVQALMKAFDGHYKYAG